MGILPIKIKVKVLVLKESLLLYYKQKKFRLSGRSGKDDVRLWRSHQVYNVEVEHSTTTNCII